LAEPAALPPIEVLDDLPAAEFAAALSPLFEGAPSFLGRLADARPFGSYADVWPRALAIALAMPQADQLELINAHPRLGASPGAVSALSFREQGYDRAVPARESEPVAAELARLNDAYEARLGFRYCVFVNGRSRAELLPVIAAAVDADRAAELTRALTDVVAIAQDRSRTLGA
jgi:2-oxo-4-hydroxy-4-carboxy--5-ureidoimidazoline (OHCU) decarboxylase